MDILLERPLPPGERPLISEILAEAGFAPLHSAGAAAVWVSDPARGEKIEFLVRHEGTGRERGRVVAVGEQAGLGAIPLEHLRLLQRDTAVLHIPAWFIGGEVAYVDVTVPSLGAYAVNKAGTFAQRGTGPGDTQPKQAKDLLYLRDLMAAGTEVAARVEDDVRRITGLGRDARGEVAYAASQLGLAIHGALASRVDEAARMLVEREPGLSPGAALADVRGHLSDLHDVLRDASSRKDPRG